MKISGPAPLAILAPLAVGFFLGPEGVVGLLAGSLQPVLNRKNGCQVLTT